ncbi:Na+/H+ antiporter [Streptomyces fractus]|uniref:Na+/H+ antiporter n=1 Tax=Streptomyces fractus TaxID=641806 RepID=UPI003CF98EE0
MQALELVVVLGVAVLVGSLLAQRSGVAPPVLLLVTGIVLGFIPAVRQTQLPPDVVLLLFLPVLLYWESLSTSLREILASLRGIVLLSTVLVILTAWAVAAAGHALGLPWGPAWVLGAAVAPTDATAVAALARSLPRRQVTVLQAESLVNDGTALVVYGLAVGITVGEEHLSIPHIGGLFLLAYGGGALVGAVVAWVNMNLRRRIDDPLLGNLVMVLAPFAAYLLAELIGASGVLAVVVSGLIMAHVAPRIIRADHRTQAMAFWPLVTFIINGSLFVLVGVQLQYAVRHLSDGDIRSALVAVGAVSLVLVAVRLAFLFGSAYLIRVLDRRPQQLLRRISHRSRVVTGLAGFRGAVSLAVALSVPVTLDSGAPFPDRSFIIFVTSGVILVTLVVQGLLLPVAVRWAKFPPRTPRWTRSRTSPRPPPSRRHSRPFRVSPPTWAPNRRRPSGCARSTRRTWRPYGPEARAGPTTTRCWSDTGATSHCTWPSSPTNGPPSSASATRTPSTTPCCAASRPPSTTRRCACPRAERRNDLRTFPAAPALDYS